jgi:hypothetical protein
MIFFIFTSCEQVGFNSVSGKYRTKGGFEWGSSIVLNKDSTFTYKEQVGCVFGNITGTWKIEGRNIILNSYLQPEPDTIKDYYIIKSYKDNSNNIIFDLSDGFETIPGVDGLMFHNGNIIENKYSDINGRLILKNQIADSIKISFVGLRNVVLKNTFNNYYQIKMIVKDFGKYAFFTNETWRIRGNNLIDKTKNNLYYERRFYKIE